jgi:hypothetical protein
MCSFSDHFSDVLPLFGIPYVTNINWPLPFVSGAASPQIHAMRLKLSALSIWKAAEEKLERSLTVLACCKSGTRLYLKKRTSGTLFD